MLSAAGVEADRVGGEEGVAVVAVELGPLVLLDGVLDGEPVQAELVGELGEVRFGRFTEVDPDRGVRFGQEVGNLLDGEVFLLQHTVAVGPGSCHVPRVPGRESVHTPA